MQYTMRYAKLGLIVAASVCLALCSLWLLSWVASNDIRLRGGRNDSTDLLIQDQYVYLIFFQCSAQFPPQLGNWLLRNPASDYSTLYAYSKRWTHHYDRTQVFIPVWKREMVYALSTRPMGWVGATGLVICLLAAIAMRVYAIERKRREHTTETALGFPIS